MSTYQALFRMGRSVEAPDAPRPPIESLVVVLSGRAKPWPRERKIRIGWRKTRWAGHRYHIDAVYQRTVAELWARGSVLWLVFVPLARDATAEAVRRVVAELRVRVSDLEERAEMYAALLVLADVEPWRYPLREEIVAMLQDEGMDELFKVSPTLQRTFAQGKQEGLKRRASRRVARRAFRRASS